MAPRSHGPFCCDLFSLGEASLPPPGSGEKVRYLLREALRLHWFYWPWASSVPMISNLSLDLCKGPVHSDPPTSLLHRFHRERSVGIQ